VLAESGVVAVPQQLRRQSLRRNVIRVEKLSLGSGEAQSRLRGDHMMMMKVPTASMARVSWPWSIALRWLKNSR
jgi:hypothetical protein